MLKCTLGMHKLVNLWSSISTAHLQYCFLANKDSDIHFLISIWSPDKTFINDLHVKREQTKQKLVCAFFTATTLAIVMHWNEVHYIFTCPWNYKDIVLESGSDIRHSSALLGRPSTHTGNIQHARVACAGQVCLNKNWTHNCVTQ